MQLRQNTCWQATRVAASLRTPMQMGHQVMLPDGWERKLRVSAGRATCNGTHEEAKGGSRRSSSRGVRKNERYYDVVDTVWIPAPPPPSLTVT